MDCPKCKVPMIVIERLNIELDYCINCGGVWFDTGELQLLFDSLHIEYNSLEGTGLSESDTKEEKRPCPVCKKKMKKIRMGEKNKVLLDKCPAGEGLWFDAGELRQIVEQHVSPLSEGGNRIVQYIGESFREVKNK